MSRWQNLFTAVLGLLCLLTTAMMPVHAQGEGAEQRDIDFDKETPSGSVAFESKQIGLIAVGGWGSGTLNFQGESQAFKISGLKVGRVGYSILEVTGQVYFLNNLENFPSTYGKIGIGAIPIKQGAVATLENSNGVVLQLEAKAVRGCAEPGSWWPPSKFEELALSFCLGLWDTGPALRSCGGSLEYTQVW